MRQATNHSFDPAHQHRRARFHYSAYWGTWSLVLTHRCKAKPSYGPTIEIDLTPIHNDVAGIQQLLGMNVRRHCTDPRPRDVFADELPEGIESLVRDLFGREAADWLLDPTTEILGNIHWERLRDLSNGGASLYAIVHPRFASQLPVWTHPGQRAA